MDDATPARVGVDWSEMKTSIFELMDSQGNYHTLTQKVYELDADKDERMMQEFGIERGVLRVVYDSDGNEVVDLGGIMHLEGSDPATLNEAIQDLFWTKAHVALMNRNTELSIENNRLRLEQARSRLESSRLASKGAV